MEKKSYRSTMPFDNRGEDGSPSISPSTSRGTMPFNNVYQIEDMLKGTPYEKHQKMNAGGDWSEDGYEEKSYRETGDDFMRAERDIGIIQKMLSPTSDQPEKWRVKVPGGSKDFSSFNSAQEYVNKLKDKGLKYVFISRIAQNQNVRSEVDIVSESLNKCYMVESICVERGVKETGSAFCIAPHLFATCAHVVKKYDKNQPVGRDYFSNAVIHLVANGKWYKAELVDINPALDLATIRADIDVVPFEMESAENIPLGSDIVCIGSPHGYENNVSTGTLGSLHRKILNYEGAPEYMFVDLSVFPGNSGGPIINKENGKVIGMVSLIISDFGEYGLNAALPSDYISNFILKK